VGEEKAAGALPDTLSAQQPKADSIDEEMALARLKRANSTVLLNGPSPCRDDWIRTTDLLNPIQQAALQKCRFSAPLRNHPFPPITNFTAFSASIAAQHFDGLFVSGFGFAASYFGLPDAGFIAWPDILAFVQRLRNILTAHHLLVDIDDGYCDTEIACHVVSALDSLGAFGVILEDLKRLGKCGHLGLHRRLGVAGAGLAVLLVPVGITTTVQAIRRVAAGGPGLPLALLPIPLGGVLVFATLVAAGILYRRRPETHKRLMLLATINILGAVGADLGLDSLMMVELKNRLEGMMRITLPVGRGPRCQFIYWAQAFVVIAASRFDSFCPFAKYLTQLATPDSR
jgi:hypothetical protein